MPEERPRRLSDNEATGEALKRLRKVADLTQEEAAARAGVVVQSWRRYEWGERNLGVPEMTRLAEVLGSTFADLIAIRAELQGDAPATVGAAARAMASSSFQKGLPIRGRIQAGAWLAAEDYLDQAAPERYPAAPDPRFPSDAQWLEEVTGDSVNRLGIVDGDLVHMVSIPAIGYQIMTDDVVKVERVRFQGREYESSLKQVEIAPDGSAVFWPRSNNARWSQPLDIREALAENEEVQITATALVLNAIKRLWRPHARF